MPSSLSALAPVVFLLAGCGHMPVTSMVKLARIDFATTDPALLRAAVKLPRAVKPRPQGVTLRISAKVGGGGQEEAQEFILRDVSEPSEVLILRNELDANTHIFAYRLDAGEATRFAAFRDALKKKREATGGRGGSLSIGAQACRTGELGAGPIYITTYLRTAETAGYLPLARDVDLRTIDPSEDLAAKIPPCE